MMTAERPDSTRDAEALLKGIGEGADSGFDIFEAALALAALERPRVDLARYREHMTKLAQDVEKNTRDSPDSLEECVTALRQVIFVENGYQGDVATYDDLQNANLMRVIDRRKGLPISLGILYLRAARAQGWAADGLSFPGHFLVLLGREGRRAIIDPFNDGATRNADDLRRLLKATIGNDAELTPQHYATVTDREVLLRLQNNVKLRLMQLGQGARAVSTIKVTLKFAPTESSLWREMAALEAKLGNLQAAITALDEYLQRENRDGPRQEAALLLQRLQRRVN